MKHPVPILVAIGALVLCLNQSRADTDSDFGRLNEKYLAAIRSAPEEEATDKKRKYPKRTVWHKFDALGSELLAINPAQLSTPSARERYADLAKTTADILCEAGPSVEQLL